MERVVYSCFKAILISILLIFAFEIIGYLYKCMVLNSKMNVLMQSVQTTVAENNYLPSENYNTYKTLLTIIVNEMNGQSGSTLVDKIPGQHWFIDAATFNYTTDAINTAGTVQAIRNGSTINVLQKKMNTPAAYGDVMVVQARVIVEQPSWGFTTNANNNGDSFVNGQDGATITRGIAAGGHVPTTEFVYTFYVPCLNFKKAV